MNFCVYNYSRDRMVEFFQNVFVGFRLIDVLDIVIVAYLVYKILGFIQETRAQQLVRGLVVMGIVSKAMDK